MAGMFSDVGAAFRNLFTSNANDDDLLLEDEIRTVLIGKTGVGKSETGNTILGKPMFNASFSGESVTKKCRLRYAVRENKKLVVVDTPGFFDTTTSLEDTKREVAKCIGLTSPGPHCFLLVLSAGRFTPEEKDAVTTMLKLFGEDAHKYIIILLTKLDTIPIKGTLKDKLAKYLDDIPEGLESLLKRCEHRCIAFDNTASTKKREKQFKLLFNLIQKTVADNSGLYYTSKMFEEAEKLIQMEIEEEKQKAIEMEDKLIQKISTEKDIETKRTLEAVRLTFSEDMKEKIHQLEQSAKEKEQKIKQEITDAKEIEVKQKLEEERERVENEKEQMKQDLIRSKEKEIEAKRRLEEDRSKSKEEMKEMIRQVEQKAKDQEQKLKEEMTDSKDIEIKQKLDEERKKVEKEKEQIKTDMLISKETAKEEKRKLEETISKLQEDMKENINQLEKNAKEREQKIKQEITEAKDKEIQQKLDEERKRVDKEKELMICNKESYILRNSIRNKIESEEKSTGLKVINGVGSFFSGLGKFAIGAVREVGPLALGAMKIIADIED